jgi:hypothetical protein
VLLLLLLLTHTEHHANQVYLSIAISTTLAFPHQLTDSRALQGHRTLLASTAASTSHRSTAGMATGSAVRACHRSPVHGFITSQPEYRPAASVLCLEAIHDETPPDFQLRN